MTTMSPPPLLVSILIRSTDRVELDEALRSVALQTWPAIEVLVIDALGAGHRALEPKCGRFPLRLESAGRHLARSAAANLGLERAHGEFLLLLDDDDWLEPEHIGRLVERLQAEPEAIAAYAGVDCVRVREDGRTETVRTYNEPYDPARLMVENTIPIHALLFRKRAVEAGCRFDEAFDLYEDWDFWLQIANLGTFSHVDAISARYRIHGESGLGVAAEETRSIEALRQLLAKWGPRWSPAQLQQLVARSRLLAQLLTQANRHDEAQQQQILVQTQRMEAQQQQILVQTQRMEALQHDISGAQRDAEDWRQRFEWVTASLSWRLTAPLRSGKSAARVAVRQARSAAWRAALWTYRQDALRPLIAAVPFGVKQRLRGFLRHEEPIPAEPLSTTPSELLVSIVIPVYNHADYIEDCITSALVQTYPHVEVVVVDDASPDARVREILHRLEGHPRLKVIYNENNLGISRTQNRALVASRGQLIGFLDCDDHLTPDAVERCVAAWNPGIVYLHTGRINMDAEGKDDQPHLLRAPAAPRLLRRKPRAHVRHPLQGHPPRCLHKGRPLRSALRLRAGLRHADADRLSLPQ